MPTELKVNPVYKYHVSPLSPDVYDNLESSIKANGCLVPIVVWDGTIVDGHNRYEICQKYGIPFEVKEEHFNSEREALLWITAQQLTRRNLTPVERVVQALKEKPTLIEMGKKKQGFRSDLHHLASDGPHNTRHIIAKMAGVTPWLVGTIEYISAHGDASLQKQVLTGEISPSAAMDIIKGEEHRKEDERLAREEAKRQAAKADRSANKGANDRWGVIIPFPKQPYKPNWCRDDYVHEPDPHFEQKAARAWTNQYQGLKVNAPDDEDGLSDDDDQYDEDDLYDEDDDDDLYDQDDDDESFDEDDQYEDGIDYQDSDEPDINTPHSSIYDFSYIKSWYRDQCDLLLEGSDDLLRNYALDEDCNEENIAEIREIVTDCFNAILADLDTVCECPDLATTP